MEETPRGFYKAIQQAGSILNHSEKINQLLQAAVQKANQNRRKIERMLDELLIIIELIRAYMKGEYTNVPWNVIVYMVAAIIYFVNPLDVIPDFLFGIGFLDDATVITFVMKAIQNEIERFKSSQKAETL